MGLQSAIGFLYPRQCVMCEALVDDAGGLCGPCWRETPFIHGLSCDICGQPLPGQSDRPEICDECLTSPRPWSQGRAALAYRDKARQLVLALKHGDRVEIAGPAAHWMARIAPGPAGQVVVPVPIHWRRMLRRRYNQAALLAQAIARIRGTPYAPRALARIRHTPVQDGQGREGRFLNMADAIAVHPRHGAALDGAAVLLVDDVMTSGATLGACADACRAAGAVRIDVVVLARVGREA